MKRSKAKVRADLRRNRERRKAKRTPGSPTYDPAYLLAHELRLIRDEERRRAKGS